MSRVTFAAVLVFSAAVFGTVYASFSEDPPVTYLTAPIERGSIASVVKATGTVNAVVTVDVGSQLSGRIAEVLVNFNDEVKAGQAIARIDPETYVAKVNEAEAALKIGRATVEVQRAAVQRSKGSIENARSARAVADAQLAGLRAKFEQTEKDVQRKTVLARTANVSDVELSRTRTQREAEAAELRAAVEQLAMKSQDIAIAEADRQIAEANLLNAEAVVEQKQAALEQAKLDLERTQIRSPIDGVVIKRDVNPGQTVAVSLEAKTLFKIANDLRLMQVDGKIDEADVGRLKEGQGVTFTVDAHPDRIFSGQVLQIRKSPEVVQNVVTYTAVISAPNPDQLLFPGMTASIRIVVTEQSDVLKMPSQALRFRPKGVTTGSDPSRTTASMNAGGAPATVWVPAENGKPKPVQVSVGPGDNNSAQLVSGDLAEGQPVIVGTAPGGARQGVGIRLGF
jgi:HlyD family secretion protein